MDKNTTPFGESEKRQSVTKKIFELAKPKSYRFFYQHLISNACKYNTNNGFIKITLKENIVTIQNDSYGIKHPNRIFDRFYKENERGLGIGLHIVERLCQELKIDKHLHINNNIFSITLNFN
jgi:two-component system OmpR family sensor kinase